MQNNENQKVLLRITNLKQYFPLKKKDLYVRANDDITLDIYEGETLGLVGESGCGKSTLGRTLLQLYRQTDGRTMYYGKTLDDIAPEYMLDTIRTLSKRGATRFRRNTTRWRMAGQSITWPTRSSRRKSRRATRSWTSSIWWAAS